MATRKHWQPQEPSLCQEGLGHGARDGRGTQVPGLWRLGSSLAVEALGLSCPLCAGLLPCSGPMRVTGTRKAFCRFD